MVDPDRSSTPPGQRGGARDEEFHSWKEIAAYLGVSARRAQQWEKELGLPVERLATRSRAHVFALRSEIDRWRRERTALLKPQSHDADPDGFAPDHLPHNEPTSTEAQSDTSGRAPHRRTPRRVVVAVAVGALGLAFGTWIALRQPPGIPVNARIVGGQLEVMDAKGAALWRKAFAEGPVEMPPAALPAERSGVTWRTNISLAQDIDGDGRTEVVFVLNPVARTGAQAGSRLICYTADGTERWRYVPGRKVQWGPRRFDAAYVILWVVGPLTLEGKRYLLVGAQNNFFPCQIALVEAATGRMVGEYWHLGGLSSAVVLDADGDGRLEAVMGGVNNPGPGNGLPALVEVRLPLPAPKPDNEAVFDSSPPAEVAYLLFPAIDAFSTDPFPARITWIRFDDWGRLEMSISQGVNFPARGQAFYVLNRDLSVVDVRPCDLLTNFHATLFTQKRLDHPLSEREIAGWRNVRRFSTMPNANSTEVRALMGTPASAIVP